METARKTDALSVLQLALSTLCFLGCIAAAALLILFSNDPGEPVQAESRLALTAYAWAAGLMAIVMALSAWYALRRVAGKPVQAREGNSRFKAASFGLLVWMLVLLSGRNIPPAAVSPWMPLLQVLSVALPCWWFIEFGRRGLPNISPQRGWGLAAVGLTLTPALLIVGEVVIGLGILVAAFIALAGSPDAALRMNELAARLQSETLDPSLLEEAGHFFITQPNFLLILVTFVAGIIPLVEELIKPLGIWFTSGRAASPRTGWIAGLISGAAFAMVESMGVSANFSGDEWVALSIQRAGTGLLHITTTALVGWGLGCAWHKAEYWKMSVAFIAAVGLHCAWNAFAVLMGIHPFLDAFVQARPNFAWLPGWLAPAVLITTSVGMVMILWGMNLRLRHGSPEQGAQVMDGSFSKPDLDRGEV